MRGKGKTGRLWKRFRDMTIRRKIISVYVPSVTIPFLILGLISNYLFSGTVITETTRTVLDDSRLIAARIGWLFNEADSCANMVLTGINNVELYNKLRESNPTVKVERKNQILNQLEFARAAFPDIDALAFIDVGGELITNDIRMERNSCKLRMSDMLSTVKETWGVTSRFMVEKRDYLTVDVNEPVVTLGKKVFDINTGDTLGYLFLVMRTGNMSQHFLGVGEDQGRYYRLLNERKEVIATNRQGEQLMSMDVTPLGAKLAGAESIQVMMEGEEYLVTHVLVPQTAWTLESGTPVYALTKDLRRNTALIIGTGAFCLMLALSGAYVLSGMLAKPIKELYSRMRQVRNGDFDVVFEREERDELGHLAQGFNSMVTNTRELINQVADEQRQKREKELALMQEQIKPHFLYNTLDLIYVLCQMDRSETAGDATKALASFYRGALSGGKELISLREEVDVIVAYLKIQGYRYSDVLRYEIHMPELVLDCIIPKLTLQPLVENAIYHGIKESGSLGLVRITGNLDLGELVLTVEDNGKGMSEEQRLRLLRGVTDNGFGFHNVMSRLRLHYGEGLGVNVTSSLEGTKVTLRLPMDREVR